MPRDFFSDIHVRRGFALLLRWSHFCRRGIEWPWRACSNRPSQRFSLDMTKRFLCRNSISQKAAEEFKKKAWGGEVWEKGFRFNFSITLATMLDRLLLRCSLFVNSINPKFKVEPLVYSGRRIWRLRETVSFRCSQ